jgi:hypothetical protein
LTLSGLDHVIRARFSVDSPDGTKGMGETLGGGRQAVDKDNAEGWYLRNSNIDGIPRLIVYGRVGSYPLIVTVGLDQRQGTRRLALTSGRDKGAHSPNAGPDNQRHRPFPSSHLICYRANDAGR